MLDYIKQVIAMPVTKLGLRCLVIAVLVLILDQASKAWVLYGLHFQHEGDSVTILPFFSLTYVQNTGMSFGLLGHTGFGRWLLTGFQLVAAGALAYGATKATRPLVAVALCMIAGGAVGNAIDRIRFGWVVDFLNFEGTRVFPWVFNVADSAICIGVGLLLLYFLRAEAEAKRAASGGDKAGGTDKT